MKKIFILSLIMLSLSGCKKEKYAPDGPTDVRVRNLSDKKFRMVIINTSGGVDTLGDIDPGKASEYFRFARAFPKAEISSEVDGDMYSTGGVDYNGMTYIGQAKITYEVIISNSAGKKIEISNVTLDAPLY